SRVYVSSTSRSVPNDFVLEKSWSGINGPPASKIGKKYYARGPDAVYARGVLWFAAHADRGAFRPVLAHNHANDRWATRQHRGYRWVNTARGILLVLSTGQARRAPPKLHGGKPRVRAGQSGTAARAIEHMEGKECADTPCAPPCASGRPST